MKRILIVLCGAAMLITSPVRAQDMPKMKAYYLVLLYKGPAWTAESTEATQKLQDEHMANIVRLAETGEMLLAGPMGDPNDDLRGIFIFEVESKEKAEELCNTDPAIQAGRLRAEVHTWWAVDGITWPGREDIVH